MKKLVLSLLLVSLFGISAFAQTTYVKITQASQLVDGGKYLIVNEEGNVAFDGSLATLDAVSNTKPVTISDGTISVTENDFYFTFDEIEGGYSVKSASGYYIGDTANVNKIVSSQAETFLNTIEFSESAAEIICSGNHLRYNANDGQTRFRYYKASGYANQQAIALYIEASYLGSDPIISIITPANGSTINTSTVTATVQITNFVAGTDGNISFSIDNGTAVIGTATSHTFEGLTVGQHTITASLVGTDETVVATETTTFTVNLSGSATIQIRDIQYTEAEDGASPYNGQTVTVSGTVTAFNNNDKFYIQDAEAAWSGLYIFNTNSSLTPALSDNVTVTGSITEYNGLTEMNPTSIVNNGASTPINGLTLASISEIAEPYESVLVTVTGTCTNIGGAKKWTISDGTSIVVFGLTYTPTVGTSYTVTGIVDWFGQDGIWELKPRSESDIVAGASVPSITISNPANGSTVYSASVNATVEVFNFEVGTDGNISFSIDNEDAISGTATSHAFTGLAEGEHTIHASLVANDQTVVASATSTFTVNLAGPTFIAIRDIQYTTNESGDSPLKDQTVWVKGVVTSNFIDTPYSPVKGYSIQDANEAWSGIWVFDSVNNPNIGDSVKFQATVTEYYGLTELKNVANYEFFDIGIVTPINVTVNEANSEAYEGCYVRVECVRSVGRSMPYGNWKCVNEAGDTVSFSHNFADAYVIEDNRYYSVAGVVEYSYGKYFVNYPTINDIIEDCSTVIPVGYTITAVSANPSQGTVTGGGIYSEGTYVTLTATASEGFHFVQWNDGNTSNPRTITVTGNATYIASFEVNAYYSSFTAEACGVYTWNEQTYTESGEYQQAFTTANSADSIVTLTLTIHPLPQPEVTASGVLDGCNPSPITLSAGDYSTYNWSTGATTATISISEPGYYYVEVTDENGCTGISEQTNVGVSDAITEAPQISVVGMNSENRNVVAWSALDSENVNAYRIYRENNVANVYEPMAIVEASQTTWTDSTADPTARAYRYKVTAVDECGGESPMSDYHKTMHLTINQGIGSTWNLIWSHYEGFDFGTYRIYRGTNPSNMTMIGEVPSNLNSYTDNTATASTGFYYQVEVVRNTRSRDVEISSRSNIVDNGIFPEYTITVMSANPNRGTVTGGGTYTAGTVITIEATAFDGYEFVSWSDENTENPRQITVTGDATYIASFDEVSSVTEYTITVMSANPNRGTVTGGGTYPEGTVITIEAIANEGFEFASWSDENTDNPRQITVTADATYIATFIPATNIEENVALEIALFPNPATDILNITSSETISEIEIVNVMGQVVKRIEVNADNVVCDVEDLKAGVYFVKIYGNPRTSTGSVSGIVQKFIKE